MEMIEEHHMPRGGAARRARVWFLAWIVGSVLLTLGDVDRVSASTAAISTLSNVGPGLGRFGPAAN